jgi:predicted phage terminase large subunit-like protein
VPHFYAELPKSYRVAHGVDLAYTSSTHADYSVCVTMAATGRGDDVRYYVLDCIRKQVEAPAFTLALVAAHAKKPGRMLFRGSGTEKGAAAFIRQRISSFRHKATRADKFVSAQEYAAAWNAGRVLLPDPELFEAPWVGDFLAEHDRFTGVSDKHDDQVDAAGSAHYALTKGVRDRRGDDERRRSLPKRRM